MRERREEWEFGELGDAIGHCHCGFRVSGVEARTECCL